MRILINGFVFNDPGNRVYLDEDIEGLDYPEIRTSKGDLSGQHGGYVGAQFLGSRPITLPGKVFSSDVLEAKAKRRELQSIFKLAPETNEVVIEDDDGRSYLIFAALIDFKMPIKRNPLKSLFKLELEAPDPIIYDSTNGSELSVTVARATSGGFTWPITWPLTWQDGVGVTTVNNNGEVFIKPHKIELTNVGTNPVLTNVTTGQVFAFTGLTTTPGDKVVINMQERTVTLNGGSILNKVVPTSSWWGLAVGPNDIKLDTGSGSDTVVAKVKWRNGVMGI